MNSTPCPPILVDKLNLKPDCLSQFADWQAKLNGTIANFPGFVSLEILAPHYPSQPHWLLIQRFQSTHDVENWLLSDLRKQLLDELKPFTYGIIADCKDHLNHSQGCVTEVFVTKIHPQNEAEYRAWTAKIHQAEVKFPGFKSVYMQSPNQDREDHWITLLQFDTPENLDRWLNSEERKTILDEAKFFICDTERHRMISPYSSWFSSVAQEGHVPPVWKQSLLILLLLFPLVMLQLKFLMPLLESWNHSPRTFFANSISVFLLSWPLMPLAISALDWWLNPTYQNRKKTDLAGTLFILFLYLLEVLFFWNFF